MASRIRAKTLPGMSVRRAFSANSQAMTTTKAGFMNSDGCSDRPKRLIQRRAPLTSMPTNSVAIISTIETTSTMSAARRAWRGVEQGRGEHHDERRQEEPEVALDEVEAVETEALGDRRTAGERQHHPAEHQARGCRRACSGRLSTTSRRSACDRRG